MYTAQANPAFSSEHEKKVTVSHVFSKIKVSTESGEGFKSQGSSRDYPYPSLYNRCIFKVYVCDVLFFVFRILCETFNSK